MSSHEMKEIREMKLTLRKMDFPALEALKKIEQLSTMQRVKQDAIMDIISEFIFCEKQEPQRGRQPVQVPPMTLMQEFQLVVVLTDYFSRSKANETTLNLMFLSLFGSNFTQSRISILTKLISLSVSTSISVILNCCGTLMQQIGCNSSACIDLSQNLVNDFVIFSNQSRKTLSSLPEISPRFACNFIHAVTEIYLNESKGQIIFPPELLLDVITEWISQNPLLPFASQKPLNLPSGAICTPAFTPISGLVRWCVLSALNKSEISYSKLHLSVLKSLVEAKATSTLNSSTLSSHHLILIMNSIHTKSALIKVNGQDPEKSEEIQISLERFAQSIQIGLSCGAIYGNIAQFLCGLEHLPSNPLMQIVIKSNKT